MSAVATPAPTTSTPDPRRSPSESSEAGRAQSRGGRRALGVLAVVLAVLWVFPIYWMINSAFLPLNKLQTPGPDVLPARAARCRTSAACSTTRRSGPRCASRWRSSSIVLVAALVFAFLAALAVSRFRFRGRKGFILTILVVQMIPAEGLFISQYQMLDGWNLVNKVAGLALVYTAAILPFTIWMLRGFVAGRADRARGGRRWSTGCRAPGAFFRITFPLLAPGLVAAGVYGFLQAWNEYTLALVVMTDPAQRTLPLWLQGLVESNRATDWGVVMAGSALIAIPVIVFFLFVQNKMTSGLVAGAVKG